MDVRIAEAVFIRSPPAQYRARDDSSTVVALTASYRFRFRVGQQFKGSGIKGTLGHTREYLSEKTSVKRFWTAQHPKLDLVK